MHVRHLGYSTVGGIDEPAQQLDDMPRYVLLSPFFSPYQLTYLYSWILAETLKYLYLLFDDTTSFKLDE